MSSQVTVTTAPKKRPRSRSVSVTKRTEKKKRVSFVPRTISNKLGSGFPQEKIVDLTYYDSFSNITGSSSALAYWIFRANSIFDPDYTGTGHQPLGRDQWAAIYANYQVLGSSIKCTYSDTTAGGEVMTCGIALLDNATPWNSSMIYIENGNAVHTRIENASSNNRTLKHSCDVAKYYAIKDLEGMRTFEDTCTTVGSTPNTQLFYHVFAQAAGTGVAAQNIIISFEMHYKVRFFNPAPLAQS